MLYPFFQFLKTIKILDAKSKEFETVCNDFSLEGTSDEMMLEWKREVQDFAKGILSVALK
jgi:hypothetical protein